jgi:hypothetical protein
VPDLLKPSLVNHYLVHKQRLLPGSRGDDVVQVARDVVACTPLRRPGHTFPSGREMLEDALYEQRALVKLLCMRVTLHVVCPATRWFSSTASFPRIFSSVRCRSSSRVGDFSHTPGFAVRRKRWRCWQTCSWERRAHLAEEERRLEDFLAGEALPPGIRTLFTRSLG